MEAYNRKTTLTVVLLLLLLLLAIAVLGPGSGCASKQVHFTSLKEVLKNISDTVESSNHEEFYELLTEKQKIGIKKEDVKQSMESNKEEFKELFSLLEEPAAVKLKATVAYSDSEKLVFVMEGEEWKIDEGLYILAKAASPEEACRELLKRLLILRELMQKESVFSAAYIKIQVDSLDSMIEELSTLNAKNIVISDDHAFLILPPGRRIEFIFEEGQWKITRIFPLPFK